MKIRFLRSPSGMFANRAIDGVKPRKGTVCDVSDDVAVLFIQLQDAEPASGIETAEAAPAENAAIRTSKPRPRKAVR